MEHVEKEKPLLILTYDRMNHVNGFEWSGKGRGIRKITNIQNMIECSLQTTRTQFPNHSINLSF